MMTSIQGERRDRVAANGHWTRWSDDTMVTSDSPELVVEAREAGHDGKEHEADASPVVATHDEGDQDQGVHDHEEEQKEGQLAGRQASEEVRTNCPTRQSARISRPPERYGDFATGEELDMLEL